MHAAADAAPFRMLCDVHLNCVGGEAPMVLHASRIHSVMVPAVHSVIVPETLDIGGLNLTPAKTGLLPAMKHKSELLHCDYVTQSETFRRAVYTSHALFYDDTTIPRQFFMYPRFSTVDFGPV
jgi:hypothetical protein